MRFGFIPFDEQVITWKAGIDDCFAEVCGLPHLIRKRVGGVSETKPDIRDLLAVYRLTFRDDT